MAGQLRTNQLWFGDNLEILRDHVRDESVDLVYLDPPFNSNRAFNIIFEKHPGDIETAAAQRKAFEDTWHWTPVTERLFQQYIAGGVPPAVGSALRAFYTLVGENDPMAYLVNMAPRLVELRRVLKPSGSLYLHCDPTMSHYLKLLLDAIFAPDLFRNEIIWKRSHAHNSAFRFGPNHDVILFYGKTRKTQWNPIYQAYNEAYVRKHYKHVDATGRLYKRENPTGPGIRHGETGQPWRGIDPTAKGRHWVRSPTELEELDAADLIYWPDKPGAWPYMKLYLDKMLGMPVQDVWTDVDPINMIAKERVRYPTQKPIALLERIISASSGPGGIVLDPFCGCGTTIDAAERLGRNWIGIDIAFVAIDIIRHRLQRIYGRSVSYELGGSPRDLAGADALFERDEFEFQTWAVTQLDAEPNERRSGDKGVDGVTRFYIDRMTTGRVIISVKGGRNVIPRDVRDLVGTIATQKAQMGVLVMRAEPSPGVRDAANHAGTYTWPLNGQIYPKIQIVTIQQLLDGARPVIPTQVMPYTRRARPSGVLDAASLLSGRVLIHARATDVEPLLGLVNGTRSGLVLTGTVGARVAARRRKDLEVECPIIFDPAVYEKWRATPQIPFRGSDVALAGRALDNFMREICKAGADAVLTPTGYVDAGDIASLAAVLDAAPALNPQAIISLPLDIIWLTYDWIDILIEMTSSTPSPKAIMLSELPRKPSAMKEILANLRLLAREVPQIGLFHTGLTAFDMMAQGALAGAIGSSSALRSLYPPNARGFENKPRGEEFTDSPQVLVSELVTYLPGNELADRFGNSSSPICHCRHCDGRSLSRFIGKSEWLDARCHNFAVWTEWLPGLLADASFMQRQLSWIRLCQRSIEDYDKFQKSVNDTPETLAPGLPLLFWAGQTSAPVTLTAELRRRRADRAVFAGNEGGTIGPL